MRRARRILWSVGAAAVCLLATAGVATANIGLPTPPPLPSPTPTVPPTLPDDLVSQLPPDLLDSLGLGGTPIPSIPPVVPLPSASAPGVADVPTPDVGLPTILPSALPSGVPTVDPSVIPSILGQVPGGVLPPGVLPGGSGGTPGPSGSGGGSGGGSTGAGSGTSGGVSAGIATSGGAGIPGGAGAMLGTSFRTGSGPDLGFGGRALRLATPMAIPIGAALLGFAGVAMLARSKGSLGTLGEEREAIGGWTVIRL